MKDKGKWFKTDDIRTLIARVQDFFNIDLGYLVDKLLELERLAEIGKATELAFKDGSKHTVFKHDIDYLLEFYKREFSDETE